MSLKVDPYKFWFSVFGRIKQFIVGVAPTIKLIIYCCLELFFLGMLDFSSIKMLFPFLKFRLTWYLQYWHYLSAEDYISLVWFFVDKVLLLLKVLKSIFFLIVLSLMNFLVFVYNKAVVLLNRVLSISVFGDICLGFFLLVIYGKRCIFNSFFKFYIGFCFYILIDIVSIILRFFYLFYEDIFYNFLVAQAIYIFGEASHSGGNRVFSIFRLLKILQRDLSWGSYGCAL